MSQIKPLTLWRAMTEMNGDTYIIKHTDHLARIGSLMETFIKVADYLGIDTEVAKSAPGNPSDVFIAAIKARSAFDEEKERALFEEHIRSLHITKQELARDSDGDYFLPINGRWSTWKACAISRAKAAGCE